MTIQLLRKSKMPSTPETFKNVVQLDLCNMQELNGDVGDDGWNFISILTRENSELKKQIVPLNDIWQFTIVSKE